MTSPDQRIIVFPEGFRYPAPGVDHPTLYGIHLDLGLDISLDFDLVPSVPWRSSNRQDDTLLLFNEDDRVER